MKGWKTWISGELSWWTVTFSGQKSLASAVYYFWHYLHYYRHHYSFGQRSQISTKNFLISPLALPDSKTASNKDCFRLGHLAALTRSRLIGDHPWGSTKEQTTETMDPSPKTKGLRLYPRQWNLELAGAARLPSRLHFMRHVCTLERPLQSEHLKTFSAQPFLE